MNAGIYMTEKEVLRTEIFVKIGKCKLSQAKAAKELNLSLRHVQRLYKSYKILGMSALASKKRGKVSNHRLPDFLIARVKELITCDLYAGFGPTLMSEKLQELHQIKISRETVRQLMIQEGVWNPKNKKSPVIHQQRQRRTRLGELVQIDGSPHAWFEDRGAPCVLLVFIDDATGRTYGKFFESETSAAYMVTTREYIIKYGKPLSMYSDKHGIFRINKPGCNRKENLTQFGRALEELEIKLICANSPQAKGRVERANQTLQDRLVKELRIARINTIEKANLFLEESFWEEYNKRFAVNPANEENAHRMIASNLDLGRILCEKHHRKVSKNLELQFENTIYQLETPSREIAGAQVTILKRQDGQISFEYKAKTLSFRKYAEQISNGEEVSSKEIDLHLKKFIKEKQQPNKPPRHHPWKQQARAITRRRERSNFHFCL